jgi:PAS domain S-box-containing protein
MSTFPRGFKAALVSALILMLTGIAWYYRTQRQRLLQEVNASLEAIVQLKIDRLSEWRKARLNEAAVMSSSRFYGPLAARWMKEPPATKEVEAVIAGLRATQPLYQFQDALFVSASGNIYFRLNPQPGNLEEESLKALARAFRTRRSALTDLFANSGSPDPCVDLVVPFMADAEPSGAILLRFSAQKFLYPVIHYWPISSRSGETLLVRRDGNDVLLLSALRYQKDAAFRLRIPLTRKDVIAVQGAIGKEGAAEGVDYGGAKVLAAIRPVPDTSWVMIAKQDESEAFSALRRESFLLFGMLLFLIASASTALVVLWQRNEKNHYHDLFEAEAEQRKSEERYRSTLDSIMEGCQIIDFNWRPVYFNATALKHSQHKKEELYSHTLMELYPGSENTDIFAAFKRCMNERTPQTIETYLEFPKGAWEWYRLSIQPNTVGIFILTTNITEQKTAQEEKDRLAAAIAQSSEAVVILDTNRLVQYVNPFFERVTGKKREEAVGKPLPVTEALDEAFYRAFWETLESGKTWSGRLINCKMDGTLYTEEATVSPVYNSKGKIINYVSVARDITESLRLQNEKEKLQEQFLQAQKMESIGQLAGGVAHDFNNMLSVIIGHVQLSLDSIESSNILYPHLQEINNAALRSADLTRQLLAFARKQTIEPRVLNLNNVVGEMLSMLQRIIGEDIDLAWIPGHTLWQVKVDPAQIDQILANLAVNARDAIDNNGRITIETENVVLDAAYCADHLECIEGKYVMLALSDNGCGMDKNVLSHIFEPFFTTKEIGKGTGLGLATVYGIVKQNHGFINIYSEPGKGTSFKVYIPRYAGQDALDHVQSKAVPIKSGSETILLVEDEPAVLNLARIMLERQGYTVIAATSPGEAIRLSEEHSGDIHLLLVDVVMPEMTGRDLSERLMSLRPGLRRLFMSGYTANVIAHQGVLDEGMLFLQKPFSARALANKVRDALDT